MEVKEKLHRIIDKIDDQEKLESYLSLLSNLESDEKGNLYDSLTTEEKKELEHSYDESFNSDNLIDHNEVKAKFSKWL